MNADLIALAIVVGAPLLTAAICWVSLMMTMRDTTGELKHWLTPDNLIKGIAIIFVIVAVLALGVLRLLDGSVIATILSGVIGYTLGSTFKKGGE